MITEGGGEGVLHLDTLGSEDKFGHHGQDVGLIKHGVSDTLQERLHGSDAVHEKPSAQESVVKQQEDKPWTHLAHTRMDLTASEHPWKHGQDTLDPQQKNNSKKNNTIFQETHFILPSQKLVRTSFKCSDAARMSSNAKNGCMMRFTCLATT